MMVVIGFIAALALQVAASTMQVPPDDADAQPDDIVVTGYRQAQDPDKRIIQPGAISAVRNRRTYEASERLAKCAARSKLSNLSRLRAVVDGAFNSRDQAFAQGRLKQIYISCSEDPTILPFADSTITGSLGAMLTNDAGASSMNSFSGPNAGLDMTTPIGRSIYDRGALTIQAIKQYAPDLRLTKKQTNDVAVQARFNAREVPLNRFRLPLDYKYFEVAVCMVRLQPELAVRLAKSEGGARYSDMQEALIDRARLCVGGAKKVSVDPTQFRMYIADAVYRWAVAARGVDSLIPAGA